MHPDLAPFQVVGTKWLATQRNAILWDQQGVGKSAQAINGWEEIQAKRILVVCPGIARLNWLREIELWSVPKRKTSAIMSSDKIEIAEVTVVSYSLLRSIKVLRTLLKTGRWDCLVLDEAQHEKSNVAWRTKAVYGVDCDSKFGLASMADRVWILSGTLMPRHPGELWTHCHALFPDVALGRGYVRWTEDYCVKARGTDRIVAVKDVDGLAKLLHPHVMRRMAKDVLPQLPPLRVAHVPVRPDSLPPMSTEVRETALIVTRAMRAMEARNGAEAQRIMQEAGEMQLASLRKWTGIALAPAVAEYLRMDLDSGLEQVVVFAEHRDVIAILEAGLPESAAIHGGTPPNRRQEILDVFQGLVPGKRLRSLVLNVEIASTAIPLTAAHQCAFAEVPWVPATIDQAVKRLHRKGQSMPVLAKLFSLQGSVHEAVISVLTRRAREVMRLSDSLTQSNTG